MSSLKIQANASGTGTTTLQTANTSSNTTFTLPGTDGTSGQFISTDGSGNLTFATGASLNTPLAVIGNASAGAEIRLPEDTDNGSNYVAIKAPDTLASDVTCTLPSTTCTLGFLNIPQSGSAKTASYTLATGDVGKFIEVGASGSITIPDATFSAGDVISIFNNTTGDVTITCTITTAYIAGTNTDEASVTLATRGICTILFISGTVCVISGNVS